MARLHFVKKARKPIKSIGVKKGDSYYWWKFNFSRTKHCSKAQPPRSALTQSEFLGQVYDLEDRLSALDNTMTAEDIQSEVESIAEEIRNLGQEQEDKRGNMPDQLQDSGSGETLQNRYDSCEEWASNLEGVDFSVDDDLKGEDLENRIEEIIEEVQGYSYEGE